MEADDRPAFPSLTDEQRQRLAERGIDAEASFRGFLNEVRSSPPPALLEALTLGNGHLPSKRPWASV